MASRRYRGRTASVWVTILIVGIIVVIYAVSSRRDAAPPEALPVPTAAGSASAGAGSAGTTVPATAALAQLDALVVGAVSTPGYSRAQFGTGWKDPDKNGCDARNDILARDLTALVFRAGTHDCVVTSGTLADPYTGTTISFVRGETTSETVQIDHIVPLSWSWSHGAAAWTADERLQFANDPSNLRAVDGPTNGSKSDSGPSDWLPPDSSFDCTYVSGFVAVLVEYQLTIDAADATAARQVLAAC